MGDRGAAGAGAQRHRIAVALVIRDLCKTFHKGTADERRALDSVSLSIADGEFVVVIGSNGSGKSTLLNTIAGQLRPDSGSISVAGREVSDEPEHVRAAVIARVLQDPMRGTLPSLTIEENLALADMRHRGRTLARALTASRRRRFAEALAGFGLGLETRLESVVGLLSGGQRQVLALAMAVLNAPRVLLLDEHTAALDPRTAELVMRSTVAAVGGAGLTTLMVTHNMQHAIDYGNRLVMMDAGKVRLDLGGEDKRRLTVAELVRRFHLADDKMLLARA